MLARFTRGDGVLDRSGLLMPAVQGRLHCTLR